MAQSASPRSPVTPHQSSFLEIIGQGGDALEVAEELEGGSRPVSPASAAAQVDMPLIVPGLPAGRSNLDNLFGEVAALGTSAGTMPLDESASPQAAFDPHIQSFVAPTLLADVVASRHSDFEPREPQALVLPGVDAVGHRPSIEVLDHQPASLHDTSSSRAARVEAIRSASPSIDASPSIENVLGAGQHDLVTHVHSRPGSPVAALGAGATAVAPRVPAAIIPSVRFGMVNGRRVDIPDGLETIKGKHLKREDPGVFRRGDRTFWLREANADGSIVMNQITDIKSE